MLAFIEPCSTGGTRRRPRTFPCPKVAAGKWLQATQAALPPCCWQVSWDLRFGQAVPKSSRHLCRRDFECRARPSQRIETQSASMTADIETNLDSIAVAGPP